MEFHVDAFALIFFQIRWSKEMDHPIGRHQATTEHVPSTQVMIVKVCQCQIRNQSCRAALPFGDPLNVWPNVAPRMSALSVEKSNPSTAEATRQPFQMPDFTWIFDGFGCFLVHKLDRRSKLLCCWPRLWCVESQWGSGEFGAWCW